MQIRLSVNGSAHHDDVEPRILLVNYLREGLEGNLCRCTGHQSVVEAVPAPATGPLAPAAGGVPAR